MHVYLIVWQPSSREDGNFLSPSNAVHAIDGRYAGLDHLLWVDATLGVYGLACGTTHTETQTH